MGQSISSSGSSGGQRTEYDEAYAASTVNGVHAKPVPAKYTNMKLFPLPRLNIGDKITFSGILANNPNQITVNLATGWPNIDYENIAFQLDADFGTDECKLNVVRNGQTVTEIVNPEELTPRSLFTELNFSIQVSSFEDDSNNQQILIVSCNGTHLAEFDKLQHDLGEIRYLMLSGDVEKLTNLSFEFA